MELSPTYETSWSSSRQVSPLPTHNQTYRWHNEYFTKDYGLPGNRRSNWQNVGTALKLITEITGTASGLSGAVRGANYLMIHQSIWSGNRKSQPVETVATGTSALEIENPYDEVIPVPDNTSDLSEYYTPTPTQSPDINKGDNPMTQVPCVPGTDIWVYFWVQNE